MERTCATHIDASANAAMARYARGDDRAFTQVYAAIAPRLTRFLRRWVRDPADLADLVQETLLRVHRARATFVAGSPVLPWVLAIAQRQRVDAHRRATRGILREAEFVTGAAPTGEEIFAAKEVAVRLDRALARISEPQRAALRLVKGEGMSLTQAAAALGTTTTGIKLRTHRAFCILRAVMANDNGRQERQGRQESERRRVTPASAGLSGAARARLPVR